MKRKLIDDKLIEINELIDIIIYLNSKLSKMDTLEYKCEFWDTYEEDYNNLLLKIDKFKKMLICRCNEYIDYPPLNLIFYTFQKKVKVVYDKNWGYLLKIPFIDKKEYYCLIYSLDNNPNLRYKIDDSYLIYM